jgi:formate hydrogenlyase subunit 3/multisubunit Na+/H+ antiporter MnhD subunit
MLAHGISTGALFLLVGMLYDRRHTFEIKEYGGLATPMPKLAAFFLFVALSSMGLPMLNGFVGEFLILLGTFQQHANWASWAALGVILSACYLLWAYQRVFFGEVTVEKNRTLPDVSNREIGILVTIAVITLWMGVGSTFFTHRFAASSQNILDQMQRSNPQEARAPMSPTNKAASIVISSGAKDLLSGSSAPPAKPVILRTSDEDVRSGIPAGPERTSTSTVAPTSTTTASTSPATPGAR